MNKRLCALLQYTYINIHINNNMYNKTKKKNSQGIRIKVLCKFLMRVYKKMNIIYHFFFIIIYLLFRNKKFVLRRKRRIRKRKNNTDFNDRLLLL